MENKSHALMTGIFTIALMIAAIVTSLWLNRDRVERVPYLIETTRSVSGLNPQAPIRYRGLEVGRVNAISFDTEVPGRILVELSVNPDAPMTESTYATLGFQGVTGIAFIQLNDDSSHPVRLSSSRSKMARIELRASIFDKLESHGGLILTQMEELTTRLNQFLTPDNQKTILATFERVTKTAEQFESIPKQLAPTLAQLPALTLQTQQALTSLTATSNKAGALADNLNSFTATLQAPNGPLNSLTGTVQHMSNSVDAIAGKVELEALPRVNALADEARTSVRSLNRSITTISEQPQSILFGARGMAPGPGEAGFVAPAK